MKALPRINLPVEVEHIMSVLSNKGFEAYVVGGCVRDSIMGRTPNDWDITTNAKPDQVKLLFAKTADTGIKHGTITVFTGENSYEVTTYRIDGKYNDYRRPEKVEFASSILADLSRRDFTINAMAYHPSSGFIDPFKGLEDIALKTIRTVGSPNERFREDALRMLRAVRFSAQLGFDIDEPSFVSIKANCSLIGKISQERIREEMTRILVSPAPSKIMLLYEAGLLHYIIPEFEPCFITPQNHPYHIYDVANHILNSVEAVRNHPILRWTMLFHDIAKPATKTTDEKGIDHFYGHPQKSIELAELILQRLRFDNNTIHKVCRMIKYHDTTIEPFPKAVRRAVSKIGSEIFPCLLEVKEADCRSQNPRYLTERLQKLNAIKDIYEVIIKENQCISLKTLALDGHDLMNLGFRPGRDIGKMLDILLDAVIENPGLNDRESLMKLAARSKRKM